MGEQIDLITLEVVREYLVSTVREMGTTMVRTAHSSIIYEGYDFSCAILDREGQLVAQSEGSPAHIIPLPWQVREALDHFGDDILPGDVIIVNDTFSSGTHMNDVAMIMPYFVHGRRVALVVVRAHWGDIGGMTPGSISGRATEIFQEGLRIPFMKIYREGRLVADLLALILANVRVPEEREGDFFAMLACCHTAAQRLGHLVARWGVELVEAIMAAHVDRMEKRMRLAIARLPPGMYGYEDYMDSDNETGQPVLLRTAITIEGDSLRADFTGSSNQVRGPVNCSLAVTAMGTFVAVKALLDPASPINHGAFRPITVTAPEGTIVNARYPAASGGFSEVRRRVETVVMGALSRAAPEFAAGDIKGATNHTYISSINPTSGNTTIFYEYPSGGTGGFLEHDGSDCVRAYDEGDFASIQSAEVVEIEHALIVESCALRIDSCGDGEHRGGLGLTREIRLRAPSGSFSELSDRCLIPPYGIYGGYASASNRFSVLRDEKQIDPSEVPGKVTGFPLREGDTVVVETAGGGGYGRARQRAVDLVERDVREGYITERRARERYGVAFRNGAVDQAATAARRGRMEATERRFRVVACDRDSFSGDRRLCRLAPADAALLKVEEGTLVEFVGPNGAPLRAWVAIYDRATPGSVELGPDGLLCLGLGEAEEVEIRALTSDPTRG